MTHNTGIRSMQTDASPAAFPAFSSLFGLHWQVNEYTYWEKKQEFLLDTDTYPSWCLFAVENGSFSYEIGETSGVASSGVLVLCPPHVPFSRTMTAPGLSFHYARLDLIRRCPVSESEETDSRPAIPVSITPGDRRRLFDSFAKWKTISPLPIAERQKLLSHYWNDIWTSWCLELLSAPNPRSLQPPQDELMNRAAKLLEQHCSQPYGVKELAHELGLSSVQLIRRFRCAYRLTPGDYLTSLRMERACRMLRETRMTVDQIAAVCGYATGHYLSRLFAARIGVAPSEYRKRHRV
ncbi:helix-turn-helix domain-containing protein [Paenibacillus oceani]|uniref:Helix-turn-helix transcriptional regulator n=1 Tax=Paenibacillus oceani TaxID=2772510 RepID=A0A927CCB6_9BACL|nr:AraC family transcriptional regulator [Paenibacillus oceani]MBD2864834.1 helix-turn-helix transcriptional regulator [Paenibacillus oceani]